MKIEKGVIMKFYRFIIFCLTISSCFCCLAQAERRSKKDASDDRKIVIVKIGKPVRLPDGTMKQETMIKKEYLFQYQKS